MTITGASTTALKNRNGTRVKDSYTGHQGTVVKDMGWMLEVLFDGTFPEKRLMMADQVQDV